MQKLSIITPVFNEEKMLTIFFGHLSGFQQQITNYCIEWIIVDDGSRDATPEIIQKLTEENDFICSVIFSRNFGKESALFAGLEHSSVDIVIPMDIDLQVHFEVIFPLIEKYEQDVDVVMSKRSTRGNETFLK